METILGKHWHHLPGSEVVQLLDTNEKLGLDHFEVQSRQQNFGPNQLPEHAGPGPLWRFLQQFNQPLVYILVVAGGVTMFLREWVDASVILGVVVLNAIVGFLQESKALNAIAALARTMRTPANVIRAGSRQEIVSEALVPGDIVLLQSGDKVPADLRLLSTRELRIDESSLTGESLPVQKTDEILSLDTGLSDRRNMAFSSSLVTYGQGVGVVVATGVKTELGRISNLISTTQDLQTPLTKRIAEFSHVLLWIILILASLTFAVGVFRGEPPAEMFLSAVALAVGAIPEGLPAAVTITLAIGVARMAQRRAVVRKLPAVETLGSTTVVCSDKTGTLTENQMTVREVWTGGERLEVSGTGYQTHGEFTLNGSLVSADASPGLMALLRAAALCNDAQLKVQDGRHAIQGDPTEGALLVVAEKAGLKIEALRAAEPWRDIVPFESQHQFMATLHGAPSNISANTQSAADHVASTALYLKGAVEKVLDRCDSMLGLQGKSQPLDKNRILQEFEAMASQGLRILAVAERKLPSDTPQISPVDMENGLTFLGLLGMIDPPRAEAIAAIYTCQTAGVKVKMITGDHAITAKAIAEQIGILPESTDDPHASKVYTGAQLAAKSDEELMEIAEQASVFARVTPEQKLRLVRALQSRGHVVAMTGDGVNDGPALKQANIGIAMGLGGTEVAKEAGHMVLTDDNFATIEAAIEEGRGVFDNLTKFIVWTLPTNLGEGLVILVAIMVGATLPILPLQILWINLTTSILLGLTLAFEPKEHGIMLRPPRDSRQPILTGTLLARIVLVAFLLLLGSFGLFEWSLANGSSPEVARTISVCVFVFGEMLYLLNCRSLNHSLMTVGLFSNGWVWLGMGLMTALQLLFVYHPLMNRMFHSAPLSVRDWSAIALASFAIFWGIGIEKWLRQRIQVAVRGTKQIGVANAVRVFNF